MDNYAYHQPVLLKESVDLLEIKPDGVYVDVTFGGGGHSREILKRLDNGRLVAFDQDPDAAATVPGDPRFTLIAQNFRYLSNWLGVLGIRQVDGILADLGVSSHQFDSPSRGFSIRHDAPLDMRMNPGLPQSAGELINQADVGELQDVLHRYGEVPSARRIAYLLAESRPFHTTGQLVDVLRKVAPRGKEHKFLAQVFQALRIAVNDEMGALREFLMQCPGLIRPGGRLVVISYHSLEDRMIKEFLRSGNPEGQMQKDLFGNLIRPFRPVYAKPIVPSDEEINRNNRARSARLRAGERL